LNSPACKQDGFLQTGLLLLANKIQAGMMAEKFAW